MSFELWDTDDNNLVGTYSTREAALSAVRAAMEGRGRSYAEALTLLREDSRGRTTLVSEGSELIDLSMQDPLNLRPSLGSTSNSRHPRNLSASSIRLGKGEYLNTYSKSSQAKPKSADKSGAF